MAGGSSNTKKENRRAKQSQKNQQQQQQQQEPASSASSNNVISMPAEEFYKKADDEFNKAPPVGRFMDGLLRNMTRCTVRSWTLRYARLPSVVGKSLAWLQLLQVDEQKAAQLKLYALGSRVALAEDDSDVVPRSRKLYKDAAPSFMNDHGLWIFSRSLVKKGYNGNIEDALEFGSYDPLECLEQIPLDPSSGVRCAEIFLFFAVEGDVPGDVLSSREAVMAYLNALNTKEGIRKIHAFTVVAGSVIATREKLRELRGKHLTV